MVEGQLDGDHIGCGCATVAGVIDSGVAYSKSHPIWILFSGR